MDGTNSIALIMVLRRVKLTCRTKNAGFETQTWPANGVQQHPHVSNLSAKRCAASMANRSFHCARVGAVALRIHAFCVRRLDVVGRNSVQQFSDCGHRRDGRRLASRRIVRCAVVGNPARLGFRLAASTCFVSAVFGVHRFGGCAQIRLGKRRRISDEPESFDWPRGFARAGSFVGFGALV